MNDVELREHLTDAIEHNPFIEPFIEGERGHRDFGAGQDVPDDSRVSLYRHIADQFSLMFRSDRDIGIAHAFLQEIEPSGWLTSSVEQIADAHGFDRSDCARVLECLQTLEPAGVFARDLKECLRLQAIDRDLLDDMMALLIANLDQLMSCDVATLARRLKADPTELARRLEHIRRMDPKPGSAFFFDETVLRGSDVMLHVTDADMTIELSQSSFPSLRLSLSSQDDLRERSSNQAMLSKLVQEAKALQSAIEMRKSTTLAVVAAIFARQREFLTHGYTALAPMRMSDIADDIGTSEATVSRVLSGLTIQCPPGCILAKSLFCNAVPYCNQPRTKHVALQMIRDLIAGEDKTAPLSDQDITQVLQDSGLEISRRTVTKYRQSLCLDAPGIRRRAARLSELVNRNQRSRARIPEKSH